MKIIATVLVLVCFISGNLPAAEEATPSPTPVYLKRHLRPGAHRRQGQIQPRRDLATKSEVKSQAKAKRRTGAIAEGQTRSAARAREKAQRAVAAQARSEAASAPPRATSDLMRRMGFSEQEIAVQKAREQSAKAAAKETSPATSSASSSAEPKPASVSPAPAPDSP